ncbi:MAG: S9 family peptidase [Bacteroidales bacterium]|nr:S9 family peptidase [Bacteroidales bacterium]
MLLKVGKYLLMFLFASLCSSGFSQVDNQKITLEDVFKKRTFSSRGVYGMQPMMDGRYFSQVKNDSLNVYDYATGDYVQTIVTSAELIPAGDTTPVPISSYEFSENEARILFTAEEEAIYRHSTKAYYYIYDIETGKLVPLSSGEKQRLATFSPDGNKVAFVRDNNIFIRDLGSGIWDPGNTGGQGDDTNRDPVFTSEMQITTDGRFNEIINGATDWVYEEEFGFTKAFFWSSDSRKIAYYRFDENRVKEYKLEYYGDIYPEVYTYKYPKAGEDNSLIAIKIYNLETGETVPVDIGEETDIYIPRIKWTMNPNSLALYRMNRHQNKLELMLADAVNGASTVILTENNPWYIDITDDWTFLKDGKSVLLTSEKDGYSHLYLYTLNGNLVRQLTSGNWEVTALYGVDEENGLVYFQSDKSSPLNREVNVVDIDGDHLKTLSVKEGYNRAQFNSDYSYYINNWSDINTPPVIALNNSDGEEVRLLQDNEKLRDKMTEYDFAKVEFFAFTTDDGMALNGWMLKPADFDRDKKYPVLFTIYGGPGSQTVANRWGAASSWNQLMAQHGIIVVSVDNRGTGARGQEFKKCTYLELGKFETLDQIEAAKYLGSLPYVDKNRIGMWGWSFGGYLTLSCLTKGADYFSMGVAVAPVTNWKYYDNIYTERFMRTPRENDKGYEDNSPVNHAEKLKGKILIIHGMADDNVHAQNTYDMITALVAADKQFDLQVYPNSNHGIYSGRNTTWHNYSRMTKFILDNL